jgi:hypothetical protein
LTLLQKTLLVASEKELHRSTKRKPVLNKEFSPPVIKIRLELTRQNLQGIYAERISVNLPNGVNNVPRLVEAFEPAASREQIAHYDSGRMSDQKIMEVVPPPPLTN